MSKIIKSLLLLAGSIIGLSSCEKQIDLNLQTSPAQVVVESVVTNGQAPYQVTLRNSGSYFTTVSAYQTVEDAVVLITQGDSKQDTLQHLGAGVYQTNHISGIQGQPYSLHILEGKSQYSAQTTMPFVIPIDSLGQQLEKSLQTGKGKPKEGYRVSVYFTDPAGIKNYYRLKVYYKGVYDMTIFTCIPTKAMTAMP